MSDWISMALGSGEAVFGPSIPSMPSLMMALMFAVSARAAYGRVPMTVWGWLTHALSAQKSV